MVAFMAFFYKMVDVELFFHCFVVYGARSLLDVYLWGEGEGWRCNTCFFGTFTY